MSPKYTKPSSIVHGIAKPISVEQELSTSYSGTGTTLSATETTLQWTPLAFYYFLLAKARKKKSGKPGMSHPERENDMKSWMLSYAELPNYTE